MAELVGGFKPSPVQPAPRSESTGNDSPVGLDRVGTVGVDLLGGTAGALGGATSATLGTLGEVVNTPWEIVAGEFAEKRLQSALIHGDTAIDSKYINMVHSGRSVSDVADQMANDGVAITGGVAHDLAVSLFLDPFNLISLGLGKGFDVAKRASDVQSRMGANYVDSVAATAARQNATQEDIDWLKSGSGKELLGRSYTKASTGLSGIKRGLSQAILGRSYGIAMTTIGVRTLSKILESAKIGGRAAEALDAAAAAANHITLNSAADLVVNRVFGEIRPSAMKKAAIVKGAQGVGDQKAFSEFARFAGVDTGNASRSLDDLEEEWKQLHQVFQTAEARAAASGEAAVTNVIFNRDVAGQINEGIGKGGTLDVLRAERTMDEVGVARRLQDQKSVAVDENVFTLASGSTMEEKIALAQTEFITNLEPIIGLASAEDAWRGVVSAIKSGKESDLRALGEAMYASQMLRFGAVARDFGAAKKSFLAKLADESFVGRLPRVTRNIVAQAQNWTVAAKDTMTDVEYTDLVKILKGGTSAVERAAIAGKAVSQYSVLRNIYDAKVFSRLVQEDPEKAVKTLLNTLDEYSAGSFVKQVPVTTFDDIGEAAPEIQQMGESAKRGGYKIVFEPETAATAPNMIYADNATRDTSRFGVDLWVPITGDTMDIGMGSRNILGKAVDVLMSEKRTSGIISNTLSRLQERVVQQNIPLSREQTRRLHRLLTDYGFKTKGSIRTAVSAELESGVIGVVGKLIAETKALGGTEWMKLDQMRANGDLQRLVFWAAEGDLLKVGLTSKGTGWAKSKKYLFGPAFTELADKVYPAMKFKFSPIFGMQEVVESKWWNLMRGYNDEWKIKVPAGDVRFGNQRIYEVVDPRTGKTEKLDALEIMSESMIMERSELKFAQEMNAINMYFAGQTTDAIMRFGGNESFVQALTKGLTLQAIGPYKSVDYLRYVSAEGLDDFSTTLSRRFEEHAPQQWATWLKAAGGDRKGASLLFLRERQALVRNRASARSAWEHNKPLGVGFGRQYDDNPIKNLDISRKELSKLLGSKNAKKRKDGLEKLSLRLSAIHADALSIGYSPDLLKGIQDAMVSVEKAKSMRVTASGNFANDTKKAYSEAMESVDGIATRMRTEFEAAVTRKNTVRDALMVDGIDQPLATEMSSLFVVAERRAEMLPEISSAVRDAVAAKKKISPETITALKDHLIKIRAVRTEEETLWNAFAYGLESAMENADKTHFFNTGRGFIERSINHPVFGLYPTSYMFGKVMPEYARMLLLSPTRSIAGTVLAPYMAIIKAMSGGKFTAADWGKYAPLVGFAAARKIREAMVNGMNDENAQEKNPLIYMFANIIIPGLPTDISVSPSAPVKRAAEAIGTTLEGGDADILGSVSYGAGQFISGTMGVGRFGKQAADIFDYVGNKTEEAGGPVQLAGDAIGDLAEGLGDILFNRK